MSNLWCSRRIIGWAHQGGPEGGRPPNTIETMCHAQTTGIQALEFDVHLTGGNEGDRKLVLHHDKRLSPEAKGRRIATCTFEQLRKDKPDLATLDEALEAFPGTPVTVEVKAHGAAKRTAQRLRAEVGHRPLIVTAFWPWTVWTIKHTARELDTSPAWPTILVFWALSRVGIAAPIARRHVALQPALRLDQVAIVKRIPLVRRISVCDAKFVRRAHERDLAVHVWTVNTLADMQRLLAPDQPAKDKVDGIMTDEPSLLMAVLQPTGDSWQP